MFKGYLIYCMCIFDGALDPTMVLSDIKDNPSPKPVYCPTLTKVCVQYCSWLGQYLYDPSAPVAANNA